MEHYVGEDTQYHHYWCLQLFLSTLVCECVTSIQMVCKPRMKRASLLTPQVVCLVSSFSSIAASSSTWFGVFLRESCIGVWPLHQVELSWSEVLCGCASPPHKHMTTLGPYSILCCRMHSGLWSWGYKIG